VRLVSIGALNHEKGREQQHGEREGRNKVPWATMGVLWENKRRHRGTLSTGSLDELRRWKRGKRALQPAELQEAVKKGKRTTRVQSGKRKKKKSTSKSVPHRGSERKMGNRFANAAWGKGI